MREKEMIQTQSLRTNISIILLFLLALCSQLAQAQEIPCDNSSAESVIQTDRAGKPLMPEEIQDNADIMRRIKDTRLKKEIIKCCLDSDEPLINHIIYFGEYVEAWKEIKGPRPALRIQDSVLWSFKKEGQVDLAEFAGHTAGHTKEAGGKITREVTAPIQLRSVTLGPSFSAAEIKFSEEVSFVHSRFPSGGSTHFRYTTFGGEVDFWGATFGGEVDFEGADFGGEAYFAWADFSKLVSFARATFSRSMSLRGVTAEGDLKLDSANWTGRIDLRESGIAKLSWASETRPSNVTGVFDAREATFEEAVIKDIHFSDLVDFSDTELGKGGNITFENVTFE